MMCEMMCEIKSLFFLVHCHKKILFTMSEMIPTKIKDEVESDDEQEIYDVFSAIQEVEKEEDGADDGIYDDHMVDEDEEVDDAKLVSILQTHAAEMTHSVVRDVIHEEVDVYVNDLRTRQKFTSSFLCRMSFGYEQHIVPLMNVMMSEVRMSREGNPDRLLAKEEVYRISKKLENDKSISTVVSLSPKARSTECALLVGMCYYLDQCHSKYVFEDYDRFGFFHQFFCYVSAHVGPGPTALSMLLTMESSKFVKKKFPELLEEYISNMRKMDISFDSSLSYFKSKILAVFTLLCLD